MHIKRKNQEKRRRIKNFSFILRMRSQHFFEDNRILGKRFRNHALQGELRRMESFSDWLPFACL